MAKLSGRSAMALPISAPGWTRSCLTATVARAGTVEVVEDERLERVGRPRRKRLPMTAAAGNAIPSLRFNTLYFANPYPSSPNVGKGPAATNDANRARTRRSSGRKAMSDGGCRPAVYSTSGVFVLGCAAFLLLRPARRSTADTDLVYGRYLTARRTDHDSTDQEEASDKREERKEGKPFRPRPMRCVSV